MNNKTRKLHFIRYKNKNKHLYPSPKWKLKNGTCRWINTKPELYEDAWLIDLRGFCV